MKVDLPRADGPHSPERTDAAARMIPEAVRYLNYATLTASGAPGISYAGDVDLVLGSIQVAVNGLQQTMTQMAVCLRDDLATGRLRMDRRGDLADDPSEAVGQAAGWLSNVAVGDCRRLAGTLAEVRRLTSRMYLESEDGR